MSETTKPAAAGRIPGGNGETRPASPIPLPAGCRRLALCFDGTWNTLESQTNVSRFFRALATADTGCADQLAFYDEGVGTRWNERITGGAFGVGLKRNLLEAYCWLANTYRSGGTSAPDHYAPLVSGAYGDAERAESFDRGDLIFLFGFSRGAFTARSLGGMINRVGLLKRRPGAPPFSPDSPAVEAAWNLYREKPPSGDGNTAPPRLRPKWTEFRETNSHAVKIACIGVWDTVGALGLPRFGQNVPLPRAPNRNAFHDTTLGRVVENAFHAVAIDEHRKAYEAALWTPPTGSLWARQVEQRWFPGAHGNVGGGYDDDLLCEAPLFWMASKAADLGLVFRGAGLTPPEFRLDGNEYLTPVRDSYAEFLFHLYAPAASLTGGRHYRPMLTLSDGIGQVVDPTARLKWDVDPDYRPRNLAMAGRENAVSVPQAEILVAEGVTP